MFKDRKLKPLSIIPYYGGKANLAYLISDLISKFDTDIYFEGFGGGGRVLLNKPPHKVEIYNELSEGVASIFKVLADSKKSDEFINCLLDTEVSKEFFEECRLYKNYIEMDCYTYNTQRVFDFLDNLGKTDNKYKDQAKKVKRIFTKSLKTVLSKDIINDLLDDILNEFTEEVIDEIWLYFDKFSEEIEKIDIPKDENKWIKEIVEDILKNIYSICSYIYENEIYINEQEDYYGSYITDIIRCAMFNINPEKPISPNLDKISDGDIKLAVAAYTVYVHSRNALGVTWSEDRYKNLDTYYKRITKLREIANRLDGVMVYSMDVRIIFSGFGDNKIYWAWDEYLNNERVVMYLDPSYLKEIDTITNNVSEKTKKRKKAEYNPGIHYNHYFTRKEHIQFLKKIRLAKCHIIISNYDDSEYTYKSYLEDGKDLSDDDKDKFKPFQRLEVETKSTLNQGKAVLRTEVLWYR